MLPIANLSLSRGDLVKFIYMNVSQISKELKTSVPELTSVPDNILQGLITFVFTLVLFLLIYLVVKLVQTGFNTRLRRWAKSSETEFDDILLAWANSIGWPVAAVVAILLGDSLFGYPVLVTNLLNPIVVLVLVLYSVRAVTELSDYFIKRFIYEKQREEMADFQAESRSDDPGADASPAGKSVIKADYSPKIDSSLGKLISVGAKAGIWILAAIIVLQNLGVNVSALVGGLGLAGLAIGFAVQNILEDIFAYFSIYFDKPFRRGDFVSAGTHSGTVEAIGIKSTRLKTLQGQQLVVPNNDIVNARVDNYKRMETRRIERELGVVYETDSELLKKVPEFIEQAISGVDDVEFDRAHLERFGDSAVIYQYVYHVQSKDFGTYMNAQQQVNFRILDIFAENGVEFAYPTQLVIQRSERK